LIIVSNKFKSGEAVIKDWLYGYSWIPEFFQTRHGNMDNLANWMIKQPNEKAVLGLRSSLHSLFANVGYYLRHSDIQNGYPPMTLDELPQTDISIVPDWKACKDLGITTIEDIRPHIEQAIYIVDNLWHTLSANYDAINKRQIRE